jgi:septal ring factor EnvC (AmiA/AmiB activator)
MRYPPQCISEQCPAPLKSRVLFRRSKDVWDKIKEFFKKAWVWFAAALGIGAAAGIIGSIGKRYAADKSELERLRTEISKSSDELQQLKGQQSITSDASRELEESIRRQSDILNNVEVKLREDERVLDDSEQQLREAERLLRETRAILEKYTKSADVE